MGFLYAVIGVSAEFIGSVVSVGEMIVTHFLDFIDNRKIVRRALLGGAAYMTYLTWVWVLELDKPTVEQVAIFAAVNTLLAAIMKFYSDSRVKN
jgi:hypothetical protein